MSRGTQGDKCGMTIVRTLLAQSERQMRLLSSRQVGESVSGSIGAMGPCTLICALILVR